MEEFPRLKLVIQQGFDNPANVDAVSLNLQPWCYLNQTGEYAFQFTKFYGCRLSSTYGKVVEYRGRKS